MIIPRDKKVFRLSTVPSERIEWLWRHRLAAGKLALLEGDPGLGKSLLTLEVLARLTTGQPLPDDERPRAPADVLLLAGEDGLDDTICPRLQAAGADLDRVHSLYTLSAGGSRPPAFPEDCDLLADTIRETAARLVVIDPLLAFLGVGVWACNDQLIRRTLEQLSRVAELTGAALWLVRHLTKGHAGRPALYHGGGAVSLIGQARTALRVAEHPQQADLRVLVATKHNLTAAPATLAYRVGHTAGDWPVIEWTGTVPVGAADLRSTRRLEYGTALPEAITFLQELLTAGPCASATVHEAAAVAGVSRRTLTRARAQLHVQTEQRRTGDTSAWYWRLPDQAEVSAILTQLWAPEEGESNSPGEAVRPS